MKKFTKAVELMQNGTFLKKIGKKRLWEVQEPFIWFIDYEEKKGKITVQKGFVTDFGSVPRIFWSFFNPTEWVAYILHDYLYSTKGVYTDEEDIECKLTRQEVDEILREALVVEGCKVWKSWIIYIAVRIGGWINWNFIK